MELEHVVQAVALLCEEATPGAVRADGAVVDAAGLPGLTPGNFDNGLRQLRHAGSVALGGDTRALTCSLPSRVAFIQDDSRSVSLSAESAEAALPHTSMTTIGPRSGSYSVDGYDAGRSACGCSARRSATPCT